MWTLIDYCIRFLKYEINLTSVVGFDFRISMWTIVLFTLLFGVGAGIFRKIYE